jgi:hypothetical protein
VTLQVSQPLGHWEASEVATLWLVLEVAFGVRLLDGNTAAWALDKGSTKVVAYSTEVEAYSTTEASTHI